MGFGYRRSSFFCIRQQVSQLIQALKYFLFRRCARDFFGCYAPDALCFVMSTEATNRLDTVTSRLAKSTKLAGDRRAFPWCQLVSSRFTSFCCCRRWHGDAGKSEDRKIVKISGHQNSRKSLTSCRMLSHLYAYKDVVVGGIEEVGRKA